MDNLSEIVVFILFVIPGSFVDSSSAALGIELSGFIGFIVLFIWIAFLLLAAAKIIKLLWCFMGVIAPNSKEQLVRFSEFINNIIVILIIGAFALLMVVKLFYNFDSCGLGRYVTDIRECAIE